MVCVTHSAQCELRLIYFTGLTEAVASVCLIPPEAKDVTVGSAGRLLPGIKARVIKSDGTLAGEGEQGELLLSGPSMASYYLDNPKASVSLIS
jgi:acyl-CoA synthetase (AMP-forming)/AMP-acid ligase II